LDKAQQGDVAAARLVLSYTLGKPLEGVEPDRLDELEWQRMHSEALNPQQVHNVLHSMRAGCACWMLRGLLPLLEQVKVQDIASSFAALDADARAEELKQQQQEHPPQTPPRNVKQATDTKQTTAAKEQETPTDAQLLAALAEAQHKALAQLREGGAMPPIVPMGAASDNKRTPPARRAANDGVPDKDTPTG
jgi:hypothetical protein